MDGPGLEEKQHDHGRPNSEPLLTDDCQLRTDDDSNTTSGRNINRSSLGSNPRRSILKNREGDRKCHSEKRISFHENLKEVHEVENWKQYNVVKKSCCEACWEECTLI